MADFTLPRIASVADPLRLAVFISGSGSGMAALLAVEAAGGRAHKTTLVFSNKADASGLAKAEAVGVATCAIEVEKTREAHEVAILEMLETTDVEAIVLSGYMRVLTPTFVRAWKGRLLNIHPSLLPKYPGAHAHRDALADGATVSGCTVHLVDEGVDTGPILAQAEVPVHPGDDVKALQERVKVAEHRLYPEVIDAFAQGQLGR